MLQPLPKTNETANIIVITMTRFAAQLKSYTDESQADFDGVSLSRLGTITVSIKFATFYLLVNSLKDPLITSSPPNSTNLYQSLNFKTSATGMTTEIDGRLCGVGLDSKPLKYGGSVSGELEDTELIRYENMQKGIAPYKNIYHGYLAELNIKCESKNCLKLNSKGEKTSEDACEEMLAAVLEKFYRIEHKDLKDTKDLPLEPNIVFEVLEDLFEDYDQEWPDRLCDDIDMWGLGHTESRES